MSIVDACCCSCALFQVIAEECLNEYGKCVREVIPYKLAMQVRFQQAAGVDGDQNGTASAWEEVGRK